MRIMAQHVIEKVNIQICKIEFPGEVWPILSVVVAKLDVVFPTIDVKAIISSNNDTKLLRLSY